MTSGMFQNLQGLGLVQHRGKSVPHPWTYKPVTWIC